MLSRSLVLFFEEREREQKNTFPILLNGLIHTNILLEESLIPSPSEAGLFQ